jgi:hypothetical protein
MGLKKCIYSKYSPMSSTHFDFVVLTSLTHPRKILLVVLQIGKAKDLSGPLHTLYHLPVIIPKTTRYMKKLYAAGYNRAPSGYSFCSRHSY